MGCPIASWARSISTDSPRSGSLAITCIAWSNWGITSHWRRNRSKLLRTRSQALLEEALLTGETGVQPAGGAVHLGAGQPPTLQDAAGPEDGREGLRMAGRFAAAWPPPPQPGARPPPAG